MPLLKLPLKYITMQNAFAGIEYNIYIIHIILIKKSLVKSVSRSWVSFRSISSKYKQLGHTSFVPSAQFPISFPPLGIVRFIFIVAERAT